MTSGGFLPLDILSQPDDTTCGPTCLHAVYRFYGETPDLKQTVAEVRALDEGGTLAVFLACHALRRGYRATIYTYNFQVFDPTWFHDGRTDIADKLRCQVQVKDDAKLRVATEGYLEFLGRGGRIRFQELTAGLIRNYLRQGRPILTGLSATFLYNEAREFGPKCEPNDIRGLPVGHFVVLCGYEPDGRRVMVADPLHPNPLSPHRLYSVGIDRVLGAILLGILTNDANLLILEPPGRRRERQDVSRAQSDRR